MKPTIIDQKVVDTYLELGYWTRDTMVDSYQRYAKNIPYRIAFSDPSEEVTWHDLENVTNVIASNLISLGIQRDARALVQIPSSGKEVMLRIAFKKAGILGCFVPMQWRERELNYTCDEIEPSIMLVALDTLEERYRNWIEISIGARARPKFLFDLSGQSADGWMNWSDLTSGSASVDCIEKIKLRQFRFDQVSLITASSGTSNLAKLNEWPEAAQICIGRGTVERLGVKQSDNIGVFAPMAGAAGILAWVMSGSMPCTYTFPSSYNPQKILQLCEERRITIASTVPVILARIAQTALDSFDLSSLRAIRVGTGVAGLEAARHIEKNTNCRVIVAAGAMECPGFGHADFNEPESKRLDGSVGLPLPGCQLKIKNDKGKEVSAGEVGYLQVSAPFASLGYWNNPEETRAVWHNGWYTTGDMGLVDSSGRLTLMGRTKEVINRSGHKILPIEVEIEIAKNPDIFQCAVVGMPHPEYGEVPWAFVQINKGMALDEVKLISSLKATGLATYKIPERFVEVNEFPRVGGNKIDKKSLLNMKDWQEKIRGAAIEESK